MNLNRRLVVLAVLVFLVLPMSLVGFFGAKTLPAHPTANDKLVTNNYVLRDAVPDKVYEYTMTRIQRYQKHDTPKIKSYTIKDDKIERVDGKYVIVLQPASGGRDILVSLAIRNYGNFFSISVVIDGKLQTIS